MTYFRSLRLALGAVAITGCVGMLSATANAGPFVSIATGAKASPAQAQLHKVHYRKKYHKHRKYRRHSGYKRYRKHDRVYAPYSYVGRGGPVIVDAPYADVYVGRGVRVRAPYVDLWVPGYGYW